MIMKTKQKSTLLLIGAFVLIIALVSGCVDVPTEGPTPPPLKSEYRFIHAATDMGDVAVSVAGQPAGNVSFTGQIAHADYGAGTKEISLSNGDKMLVSLSTDYRGTFVILNKEGAERTYLKLTERRMFDAVAWSDTAGTIRAVNCSPDAGPLDITVEGEGVSFSWASVPARGVGAAQIVKPGTYTVSVRLAGMPDVWSSTTVTVGKERNTVLVVGSLAASTLQSFGVKDN